MLWEDRAKRAKRLRALAGQAESVSDEERAFLEKHRNEIEQVRKTFDKLRADIARETGI